MTGTIIMIICIAIAAYVAVKMIGEDDDNDLVL